MKRRSKFRLFLKPNTKRGLIRLWFVLSIFWIGFSAYYSSNNFVFFDIPEGVIFTERFKASQDYAIKMEEEYEATHNLYLDNCPQVFIIESVSVQANSCFGKGVRLGQYQLKYLDEHDDTRSSIDTLLPKNSLADRFVNIVWLSFIQAFGISFLPPLLLILSVFSFNWIVRGFRS